MKPLRIAHMADTHLGYRWLTRTDPITGRNQRSVDIEHAFSAVVDDLLSRKVDLVLHGGDLFHHARPAFPAIGCAIREFRRLQDAGIPTYVIGGNHDTPRLRSSGSVFALLASALPEIHFAGGYEEVIERLPDLDLMLTLIPHGRLTDPEPPIVFPAPDVRNVLMTHGLTPTISLENVRREPGEEEIAETLLDRDFDYIALGHYHEFHQPPGNPNAWYSGATERIGWGDRKNTPGYVIVELDDTDDLPRVEHTALPTRAMHQIDIPDHLNVSNDADKISRWAIDKIRRLNDPSAMIRIVLSGVSRATRRRTDMLIREEAVKLAWSIQVLSRDDLFAGFSESREGLPSINLLEQFAGFIDQRRESGEYDPEFAEAFLQTGTRELEHAIEEANAAITTEGAE